MIIHPWSRTHFLRFQAPLRLLWEQVGRLVEIHAYGGAWKFISPRQYGISGGNSLSKVVRSGESLVAIRADIWPFLSVGSDVSRMCQ